MSIVYFGYWFLSKQAAFCQQLNNFPFPAVLYILMQYILILDKSYVSVMLILLWHCVIMVLKIDYHFLVLICI